MFSIRNRPAAWFISTALLSIATAGCGAKAAPPALPPAPTIAVSLCGESTSGESGFPAIFERDAREAAAQASVLKTFKLEITVAANRDAQFRDVARYLNPGTRAVIVQPLSAADMSEPMEKMVRANIPVIALERPLLGNQFRTLIAADDREIGRLAARWIASAYAGPVSIVQLSGAYSVTSTQVRAATFLAALTDPRFHVLLTAETEGREREGYQQMQAAIHKGLKIDVVFVHAEPAARGAARAIHEAGMDDHIRLVTTATLDRRRADLGRPPFAAAAIMISSGGRETITAAEKLLSAQETPREWPLELQFVTAHD